MAPIVLLTDFGLSDAFVGILKGVIHTIAPKAVTIDLGHQVPLGDIQGAAFLLKISYRFFPEKTIFLTVVDPGVGGERNPIAAQVDSYYCVGPDNGVFGYLFEESPPREVILLTEEKYFLQKISHTFHGRDIFAPTAAHVANGVALRKLGVPIENYVPLPFPKARVEESVSVGRIIYQDIFGNLVTSITQKDVQGWTGLKVHIGDEQITSFVYTYSQVPPGQLLFYFGSSGFLEVACRDSSAAEKLRVQRGERVVVERIYEIRGSSRTQRFA